MKKTNSNFFAKWAVGLMVFVLAFGVSVGVNAQNCSLVCNNLVQVSLDEDCEVELDPDMILEGDQATSCPNGNLQVQIKVGNNWVPAVGNAVITVSHINQTLQVRVRDLNSGNNCWGYAHVEDKLAPALDCHDITVACAVNDYTPQFLSTPDNPGTSVCEGLDLDEAFPNLLPYPSGNVVFQGNNTFLVSGSAADLMENCTNVSLSYIDTWFDLPCGLWQGKDFSAYIRRVWTAVDQSGNTSTCTQFIYLDRMHIADVEFPADVTVSCENPNTNPSETGAPYIVVGTCEIPLYPATTYCELNVTYTDQLIKVCDGTKKILRTWAAYDWCAPTNPFPPNPNPTYHIQLVKIIDDNGPEILTPDFCGEIHEISVSGSDCVADWDLPDVKVTDNCSRLKSIRAQWTVNGVTYFRDGYFSSFLGNNLWNPDTLGVLGIAENMPLGQHTVTYIITDDCGNSTTCQFTADVLDGDPPSAVCDEYTQVSLGTDGMVFVNASTFDDGSTDACGPVYFKVRRMDPNPCQDNEYFYDQVKFCCSDIGDTVMVVFRVYDVEPDPGTVTLDHLEDNANECMVEVFIDDKLKPTCTPPQNVTVSCEAFDPSLWAYGNAVATDNCCLEGVTASANYAQFDTLCNRGTIIRRFVAKDCGGQTNQCTQRIVVDYRQDYHIRFPNDRVVNECDGTTNFGEPVINKKDCELMAISHEDQIFTVVPDACYKIERVWTIINWCTYDPNDDCIYVPNPTPNALPNASANLQGPTVSPAGTPNPWAPTVVALTPGGPQVNFSQYWSANANCYQYRQIIKVIDNEDPFVVSHELDDCDLSPNDPLFWNTQDWWDPIHGSHDLCEAPVKVSITAFDSCSLSNLDIHALVFLDLNGDGNMETVLNTNTFPTLPPGFIYYNNVANPNYSGGIQLAFDHRPVPANLKYRFALREQVVNGHRKVSIAWTDQANPNPANNAHWVLPQIPLGKHKIKWFVEDNCGNETVFEKPWDLHDCKAPTVVCLNGLSVNIMPTKMIVLWTSDFLHYGEDNCTPANQLVYSIRKSGTGQGFPVDQNGNPINGLTWTCNELGTQYVELWAKDARGNAAFCETYVIIQDPPPGNCGAISTVANVAGAAKVDFTNPATGVEDVQVNLTGQNPSPGQPDLNMFVNSSNQGTFNFNAVPIGGTYNVAPAKDNDPLNGVTTYDLLLISKHILGVEPLNTPYKMIGADANRSGSITTFDIVELRKLVLGIYSELPNNTSWRFVDKGQTLDPNNPFVAPIREACNLTGFNGLQTADFVSVKVGDMNGNAVANNLQSSDDRTAGTAFFDVENQQVKAGEEVLVHFKSAEKLAAFQFTLNFDGLRALEVLPGENLRAENFAVFENANAITTSVDGNGGEFSIRFRALRSGKLSEILSVGSRITRAEANNLAGENLDLVFRFNGFNGSVVAGEGFELFQNTPNPVNGSTAIAFNLPEASTATLKITTIEGRLVKTVSGEFAKGLNTITLNRNELEAGLLFYQLDTPTASAVKKMIVVD